MERADEALTIWPRLAAHEEAARLAGVHGALQAALALHARGLASAHVERNGRCVIEELKDLLLHAFSNETALRQLRTAGLLAYLRLRKRRCRCWRRDGTMCRSARWRRLPSSSRNKLAGPRSYPPLMWRATGCAAARCQPAPPRSRTPSSSSCAAVATGPLTAASSTRQRTGSATSARTAALHRRESFSLVISPSACHAREHACLSVLIAPGRSAMRRRRR
jgi:hypothetical protein